MLVTAVARGEASSAALVDSIRCQQEAIPPHFAPRSNVQPTGGFIVPDRSQLRLPLYPYSRHDGLGQSPAVLE